MSRKRDRGLGWMRMRGYYFIFRVFMVRVCNRSGEVFRIRVDIYEWR